MQLLQSIVRRVLPNHEHATADRLFVSQHVKDLRLIITAASIGVGVVDLFACARVAQTLRGRDRRDPGTLNVVAEFKK
jgi:hypothetical protein